MTQSTQTLLNNILPAVLPYLIAGVVAATGWLFAHLGAFLKAKSQGSKLYQSLYILDQVVASTVQDIEAQEKQVLIQAGNGVLTKDTADKLKATAVARVKAALGEQGLSTLQQLLGVLLAGSSLDGLISGKVEQAVAAIPSSSSLAAASPK